MKWGRKWGNYWGNSAVSPLSVKDFAQLPPTVLLSWSDPGVDNQFYIIYVDGKRYGSTTGTSLMIQHVNTGRHWYEVFLAGPGCMDEDLSEFISTVPGCRARLSWTQSVSTDVDHYDVYWDQGLGGGLTYLDRTDGADAEFISDVLDDGTYVFRVDAVDRAGNRTTSSSTVSVTISRYPNPPSDLELSSYNNGTASFTFTESDTAGVTGYRVYHNSGSGNIDYDAVKLTVLAGNTTFDLSVITSGDWRVGLRAYNGSYEEDNIDVVSTFRLGGSPIEQLENQPNTPVGLEATPIAGGEIRLQCTYFAMDEAAKATQINFYADDGAGGSINYTTAVATGSIDDHQTGEDAVLTISADTNALTDGSTYTFAAKAATASGTESDASDTTTGTADSTAPTDITSLAGEAVNYEQ